MTNEPNDLMTIRDLAERWGVSLDRAKRHVRKAGVPFFRLADSPRDRISWGVVRFRAASVAAWEQSAEQAFDEATTVAARPTKPSKYKFMRT